MVAAFGHHAERELVAAPGVRAAPTAMNFSKPCGVVGGGEMNFATSSDESIERSDVRVALHQLAQHHLAAA